MSAQEIVLAVDGGNSKTDLALLGADGHLLARSRGPSCSPHRVGFDGCVRVIDALLKEAFEQAGGAVRPAAAAILVAGADLESEEQELREHVRERDWSDRVEIGNDTMAVLRAGSDEDFGVAIVCGAGINAIGVGTDGRQARFPALGAITGDWGGGEDLGIAALGASVRAQDGRGPATALSALVPAHFGVASAEDVALSVHRRELEQVRLAELAPLVLGSAEDGDEIALALRERLVAEVAAFATAAAGRVLGGQQRFDVVLGGSLLSRSAALGRLAGERIHSELPGARPIVSTALPVAGSALVALEMIGAEPGAAARVRAGLAHDEAAGAAVHTTGGRA